MHEIKLYTYSNEFVYDVYILPFKERPKVVVWGSRIFLRETDEKYIECFTAMAFESLPAEHEKKEEIIPKLREKHPGNDDLLFGLPANLDEAIEGFIAFFNKDPNFDPLLKSSSEDHFLATGHHGGGQFIRNSWFLWWHPDHGYKEWPESKPPLIQWFNDRKIVHADDMSGIIITSAYRAANNIPIDLEGQIKKYHDHWKKQGFSDGIPHQNNKP